MDCCKGTACENEYGIIQQQRKQIAHLKSLVTGWQSVANSWRTLYFDIKPKEEDTDE